MQIAIATPEDDLQRARHVSHFTDRSSPIITVGEPLEPTTPPETGAKSGGLGLLTVS